MFSLVLCVCFFFSLFLTSQTLFDKQRAFECLSFFLSNTELGCVVTVWQEVAVHPTNHDGRNPEGLAVVLPRVSLASTQPVATLPLSLSFFGEPSYKSAGRGVVGPLVILLYETALRQVDKAVVRLAGCYCWRCVTSVSCVGRHWLTWLQVLQLTAVTAPSSSG